MTQEMAVAVAAAKFEDGRRCENETDEQALLDCWSCCKVMGWKKIVETRKLRKSNMREMRHGKRVHRAKQRRRWRMGEKVR